jgi:chitinase
MPTPVDVTANYTTSPGTAISGVDYTAKTGTVTIPAGQVEATVTIAVRADAAKEADETFMVTLSAPTNAILVRATGTGTILNDDLPGIVIGVGNTSIAEGNAGNRNATVVVTLSQPSATDTTVHWATAAGTATDTDFAGASNDLIIPAGRTTGLIAVTIKADVVVEGDETLTVTLSAPSAGTLGRATGIVTILNDD